MKAEFYIERLLELESKHESELTIYDHELIREYSIELEILRDTKGNK